jgi:hypothetical protein
MKKGNRKTLNKDEVKGTMQALEKVHNICSLNKGKHLPCSLFEL